MLNVGKWGNTEELTVEILENYPRRSVSQWIL